MTSDNHIGRIPRKVIEKISPAVNAAGDIFGAYVLTELIKKHRKSKDFGHTDGAFIAKSRQRQRTVVRAFTNEQVSRG